MFGWNCSGERPKRPESKKNIANLEPLLFAPPPLKKEIKEIYNLVDDAVRYESKGFNDTAQKLFSMAASKMYKYSDTLKQKE